MSFNVFCIIRHVALLAVKPLCIMLIGAGNIIRQRKMPSALFQKRPSSLRAQKLFALQYCCIVALTEYGILLLFAFYIQYIG